MAEQPTTDAPDGEPKKRPASQYYWGDWLRDAALRMCPLVARGLWHEMNCVMHQGEPYGHLYVNGRPMSPGQLANLVNIPEKECKKLLGLLEDAGVFSRDANGAIFSRRMVRDEIARNARAEGGKGGAEHGAKGGSHGAKGGRPKKQKGGSETPLDDNEEGDSKTPQKPPPSSSSSSSSSASAVRDSEPVGSGAASPPPPPSPSDLPMTAKELAWSLGVAVLGEKGRSHLGKLVATYGEAVVAEAAAEAVREKPGEPKAWLTAACEARAKSRSAPKADGDQALLDRDPRPQWVIDAGFPDIWQAESSGCGPGNFRKFAGGKRVTA